MSSGRLRDLVDQVTTKAHGRKSAEFPYVGLENIEPGGRTLTGTAPSSVSESTNGVFENGDILFGKLRPNLRKAVQVDFGGYCSTDLLVLRPRTGVDVRYAGHVSASEPVFRHAERNSIGTGMPRTSWHAVCQAPAWVPSLEEQRRVAEILGTIDETIQTTERVITKLIRARRGQVDDLLGPLPLNSSLGSGLERIDAGWSPFCVDRPPMEQEWGVLKVSSITTEEFDPSESKTIPTTLRYRPQLMVKVGDVLTARANGVADLVARTAIVDHLDHKNLMISDKTLRLVTRPALSARYLTYCMQHEMVRCQVRRLVSGSTGQGNISQQELRSLRLAIPDLRQQMHVEQAITAIDARIAAEKNRNKKLRQLRSGLAADLLSDRVRTVAA